MPHKHSVHDTDTHFIVDGITRAVKNASGVKTMLVQGDHNSERFTFELPRMIDGHDISLCNDVKVHYTNIDSKTREENHGVYVVDDLQIFPADDEVVVLSWLISSNATQHAGGLLFGLSFRCLSEDGAIEYAWNTVVHKGVSVSSGINNSEFIVEEFPDVIAQLEARIQAVEKGQKGGSSTWAATIAHAAIDETYLEKSQILGIGERDVQVNDLVMYQDGKVGRVVEVLDDAVTTVYTGINLGVTVEEPGEEIFIPEVVQTAGDSEEKVMSQKAVTNLVANALGSGGEYETVTSVEEMTDRTKKYVLNGTIWECREQTVEVEVDSSNKFVPSTALLNQRMSGSSGSVSGTTRSAGSFVTDFIDGSDLDFSKEAVNVRLNFEAADSEESKVIFYKADKTRENHTLIRANPADSSWIGFATSNGETVFDLKSTAKEIAWDNVAYVRFQLFMNGTLTALNEADIANVEITFGGATTTTTEYIWVDTGVLPQSGEKYNELVEEINLNKRSIEEVSARVTVLESGIEIPSFWKTAVDTCVAKIKQLQIGRNCVTFPFFSDNHTRNGYAGVLISHVMKECNIPYAFYGGDSISNGYIADEATMIEQDRAFDASISQIPKGRFCRAVGNHDGYWQTSDGVQNRYEKWQIFELFLREESVSQLKHFGGYGTYYYVDDVASQVRWIVLDTNRRQIGQEQLDWLENKALSFNESGWAVVFISHQPISNHYHAYVDDAEAARSIVKGYINGTSNNKADVVGWFSGHIHRDRIYTGVALNTSDDSEGEPMGFTQITITSDATNISYDDETKQAIKADDKSHAIDFVTINKQTRTVNITRLGIGSDRAYTY